MLLSSPHPQSLDGAVLLFYLFPFCHFTFAMLCPLSPHTKGVTLTDLKEAEKTMGRAGDSKTTPDQRSKEDEKCDKDGEQPSQETTVDERGLGFW